MKQPDDSLSLETVTGGRVAEAIVKPRPGRLRLGLLLLAACAPAALTAVRAQSIEVRLYTGLVVTGTVNVTYALEATADPAVPDSWTTLTNVTLPANPWLFIDYDSPQRARRFYRMLVQPPAGTAFVPPGAFEMGDMLGEGTAEERPAHTVQLEAFFIERHEVTKALWDEVYQWATNHGYSFESPGYGKAPDHPVQQIPWPDAVKWCNARSERDGKAPAYYTSAAQTVVYRTGELALEPAFVKWNAGYRLPTEAEWEKAARGGLAGRRFPWTEPETITHNLANYYSSPFLPYDLNPTPEWHLAFNDGTFPYTSPVGYFASNPNGYGLFDLAGNVWEWCFDWYDPGYYSASPPNDPRGPAAGEARVVRGGSWNDNANGARVSARASLSPHSVYSSVGFRCVLPPGTP